MKDECCAEQLEGVAHLQLDEACIAELQLHTLPYNLKHWHFHFIFNVYPGKTCSAHMPFFSLVLFHIHTHQGAAQYILAFEKL